MYTSYFVVWVSFHLFDVFFSVFKAEGALRSHSVFIFHFWRFFILLLRMRNVMCAPPSIPYHFLRWLLQHVLLCANAFYMIVWNGFCFFFVSFWKTNVIINISFKMFVLYFVPFLFRRFKWIVRASGFLHEYIFYVLILNFVFSTWTVFRLLYTNITYFQFENKYFSCSDFIHILPATHFRAVESNIIILSLFVQYSSVFTIQSKCSPRFLFVFIFYFQLFMLKQVIELKVHTTSAIY